MSMDIVRIPPRKLNRALIAEIAKSAGGAAAAYVVEDYLAPRLVQHAQAQPTAQRVALNVLAGFGPPALVLLAASRSSDTPTCAAYLGATVFNRLDNLAELLGVAPMTPRVSGVPSLPTLPG